jgi:hypothetical protein
MRMFWVRKASEAEVLAQMGAQFRCGFTDGYGAATWAEAYRDAMAKGWQPGHLAFAGLTADEVSEFWAG